MRIPLSWLREFAQVPADATAEDVMADLVKVGFEEEEVHRPTDELTGPVVVGQVLSLVKEPQTNGKTINWCQVRVVPEGQEQTLTGKGIDPSGVQGIICVRTTLWRATKLLSPSPVPCCLETSRSPHGRPTVTFPRA